MQQEFIESTRTASSTGTFPSTTHSTQHGTHYPQPGSSIEAPHLRSRSSSHSVSVLGTATSDDFEFDELEERLRRLSHGSNRPPVKGRAAVAGQRIVEYENALTPSTSKQGIGFKVIKRAQSASEGVQLTDFPNGTTCSFHSVGIVSRALTLSRTIDAYPVSSASRFACCSCPCVETFLCSGHRASRLAHGVLALLPGTRGFTEGT